MQASPVVFICLRNSHGAEVGGEGEVGEGEGEEGGGGAMG